MNVPRTDEIAGEGAGNELTAQFKEITSRANHSSDLAYRSKPEQNFYCGGRCCVRG